MQMYSFITRSCIALFLVLQGACANTSYQKLSAHNGAVPVRKVEEQVSNKEGIRQQIGKDQAIAVANEDATKSYRSLSSFKVVACERARLWVIIYDRGGPEYYIDKISGNILTVQTLPQGVGANAARGEPSSGNGIDSTGAIEIARNHFVDFLVSQGDAKDHVNGYDAVACELENAWRVFFEHRPTPGQNLATLPNSNPPNYLIDKKSGKIVFTTHRIAK